MKNAAAGRMACSNVKPFKLYFVKLCLSRDSYLPKTRTVSLWAP
jgi:hypothetical protein